MRPLKSHCPAHALTTCATMLQQTTEVRVLRWAQTIRAVVAGQHVSTVSPRKKGGDCNPSEQTG